MSSVTVLYIKGFVFSFPAVLWDVKLPCSFSCICKKTGNLSDLFLSLKGKSETGSNLRGLKMLQLDQMLSFSDLHLSLESSLHRVFRHSTSFLAPPCLLKRKGCVDALCLTGYGVEGFVHSNRISMEEF